MVSSAEPVVVRVPGGARENTSGSKYRSSSGNGRYLRVSRIVAAQRDRELLLGADRLTPLVDAADHQCGAVSFSRAATTFREIRFFRHLRG